VITIFSAIAAGVGVLLAGNLPWAALFAPLNLRFFPVVPWAIVPMAIYLWLYWQFAGGRIGPRQGAATRRLNLRANPLTADAWMMAMLTGLIGFGGLLSLVALMARLVTMPSSAPIAMPAQMPAVTGLVLLVMASIVAGVTEEAGFRGYMQGPIERRYGLALGILVNGVMFGILHFPNHPGAVASMLPYYIAVAGVYGGITWATNSILPAVVLHAGGDVWSLTRLWITGQPEWQLGSTPASIWETGIDDAFLITAGAGIVLGTAFVLLCRAVRRLGADHSNDVVAAE
jgi:membrane protease YdiL (CAAX protease family)